jgi:hypothetical protein
MDLMNNHQEENKESRVMLSPAPALAALLENSLDYAGIFPPASLPFDVAVRRYAAYVSGPEAWMVANFVCPVKRLRDLDALLPLFHEHAPLRVSVLAGPPATLSELRADLREMVESVAGFQRSYYPKAFVNSLEISLPADSAEADASVRVPELMAHLTESLGASGIRGVTVFFEPTADWGRLSGITMEAVAVLNSGAGVPAAFKLRTGGVTADAFPTIDRIAYTIAACQELGIGFKCTAGLHHPIRRESHLPGVMMHGFLNVFVAAVLAHGPASRSMDLRRILAEEDASQLLFDEEGLTWREMRVPLAAISAARRELILSFGSCSVDEPLEDLKALGML